MWRFTDQYQNETNARPDGRDENQFRDILINWNSIGTANGSAIIKLGNTTVASGITFEENLIELNDDNNQNIDELTNDILSDLNNLIDINVKYQPHSSFCFKIESNDQDTKESLIITTHFKNIFINSSIFNLNQLIKYDENKLIINKMIIEILIENYDGNGFDASNLALLASIIDCKLDGKQFEILNYPISTTFAFKLKDNKEQIFQDPNLDDEKLCDGQFNITVNADTNELVFLNKKGDQGLNFDLLNRCINLANKRASSIKQLLKLKQTKF